MDDNIEWESHVFSNKAIPLSSKKGGVHLPPLLQEARHLEKKRCGVSDAALFLNQGRLLADYEDDYPYRGNAFHFYPTYRGLSNSELRGYFTWRTRVRKGDYPSAPTFFLILYLYELINNIGVSSPQEGLEKILSIREHYGHREEDIPYYLKGWLPDYLAYYGLDPGQAELGDRQAAIDALDILEDVPHQSQTSIVAAVKKIAPKWLKRSKFYNEHQGDMDAIIARVLGEMTAHHAQRCKKTFVDQYFGRRTCEDHWLFGNAIFGDPLNRQNYFYSFNNQHCYKCEDGQWSICSRHLTHAGERKLEKLLKAIDSLMRELMSYGHPITRDHLPKWLDKAIRTEITTLLSQKEALKKKKITIDYSSLDQIRQDAAQTQEKLLVEEEVDAVEEPAPVLASVFKDTATAGLSAGELRLLRSLLYHEDIAWVKQEGYLLSVLLDGINEKLYDRFADTVLDDTPQIVADYADELKEMFPA